MRIALVWPFNKAKWIWPNYRDGVRAMVEHLNSNGHVVEWFLDPKPDEIAVDTFDAVLVWTDSSDRFASKLPKRPSKLGLLLTTELGLDGGNLKNYDVVFCEAKPVYDAVRAHGVRAIHAFGTDTKFFHPEYSDNNLGIVWHAFYPATFSPWKRQDIFARHYKDKGLLLGTIQPDGWGVYHESVKYGVNTMVGYFPVKMIRQLYLMSEQVHITGYEGSGRTVIEAMSMGLPVIVEKDNDKCQSYCTEWRKSDLEPREFVLKHYSEKVYADKILKGLE